MKLAFTANNGQTTLNVLSYDIGTHKVNTLDPSNPEVAALMCIMRDILSGLVGDVEPLGLTLDRDAPTVNKDAAPVHYCAHPDCPGLPYMASETPHPCGTGPHAS